MLINCDIGERGVGHADDDHLMQYIDIANIACGGHAGDEASILHYRKLADQQAVKVTAHLSYPDKKNFGRKVLDIAPNHLLDSLNSQYRLISDIKAVKLHGALYNRANVDIELAECIGQWLAENSISEVLTQADSKLALVCKKLNIKVIAEAFLDRRYIFSNGLLQLMPRNRQEALIEDTKIALAQYENFLQSRVDVEGKFYPIVAQTLCLHSDSPSAMAIMYALRSL